jgi:hypothetical protein
MANATNLNGAPILLGNRDNTRGHRTSHNNDDESLRKVGRDSPPLSSPKRGDYFGDARTGSSFCRDTALLLALRPIAFPIALLILPAPGK